MKTLLLFLFSSALLFSAPAYDAVREFTNADGTTFMAKGQGNQHLHWIQTQDGEILKYNEVTKNFEYAKIENNALVPSGVKYEKNDSKRARALHQINKLDKSELSKLWGQRQKAAHERAKGLLQD
ncbi:MAG: hypothetical protein FP820_04695 [Sulfurimonas sp.]|jgi:hypothetical protein|nr:hypothetical protein [Sulfurimonas sp.]MBU1218108.1 hypothetical protein [bacterium]MBU1434729.1 hypothetical protein [bacterium]MBU1502717.1 hypothetical protein [bacterium]MBU3940162.1 hypothetical protein [bacterium]